MCGITGRSYTYRLSGSFNQRTVAIELAGNLMLMLLFFIVFVGVAVIVVGVGVAVFLLLCTLINNIEQGGCQMQCQCDQLVPGPGEVSNG